MLRCSAAALCVLKATNAYVAMYRGIELKLYHQWIETVAIVQETIKLRVNLKIRFDFWTNFIDWLDRKV